MVTPPGVSSGAIGYQYGIMNMNVNVYVVDVYFIKYRLYRVKRKEYLYHLLVDRLTTYFQFLKGKYVSVGRLWIM